MANENAEPDWANNQQLRDLLMLRAGRLIHPGLRQRVSLSDLVQETMVRAVKNGDKLANRSWADQQGWLFKTLKNVVREQVRNHCRECRDARQEESLLFTNAVSEIIEREVEGSMPSPDVLAARREEWQRVANAIAQLTLEQRNVAEAHFLDGLTHKECAQHLGLTEGQVKGHLKRAVPLLRRRLSELGSEQ